MDDLSAAEEEYKKLLDADSGNRLLFADAMGTALYESGDLTSARQEYQRIISMNVGRFDYGDIYAKAHYQLGKISEQQGKKAEAAEHYQKFLSLWKEADSGLPEVEDARKSLACLKP